MPIAIDGKVYDDELSYTAKLLGIELPTPEDAPGSSQTQDGTRIPPTENNASAGNVEGKRGIVDTDSRGVLDNLLGQTGERYQTWPEKAVRSAIQAFALPGDVLSGKVQPGSPQEIERAMDLAGLMVGGPAPVAAKMADGTLGSFAGVVSKTIDKNKLAEAQVMKHNGASSEDIWEKTGFFKGADDRWRYEIPDNNSTLNKDAWNYRSESFPSGEKFSVVDVPSRGMKLNEALDHPELFKAYPHLKDIEIKPLPSSIAERGTIGQMVGDTMYLRDGLDPEFARSVLFHELQHSIQNREGFARGGSSIEFQHPALGKAQKLYDDAIAAGGDPKSESLIKAQGLIKQEIEKAHTLYTRLMGEVESRNVQTRIDYNDLMRKQNPPISTEEVPRFLQISR